MLVGCLSRGLCLSICWSLGRCLCLCRCLLVIDLSVCVTSLL